MVRNKKAAGIPFHTLAARKAVKVHLRMMQDAGPGLQATDVAHRDDYYIFLFQTAGESRLMVDFKEVTLTGPCIYYLLPGQIHHYNSTHDARGWLLAAEPLAVDEAYRQVFEETLGSHQPVIPDEPSGCQLEYCLQALSRQVQLPGEDMTGNTVLAHLVAAYTGIFARIFLSEEQKLANSKGRPAMVTRQFRSLLRKKYVAEKSPAAYAALLHLSLTYLNECVKEVTGKPVSYWIQQEILLEAKRQLAYTTLSVKEIAYKLGYDDHTYFSRLFNKATGTTAARFRQEYRG